MDSQKYLYQVMIGTGGIGSGTFFLLNDNHTLGREESRSGHYLDKNDYCKLHIISHYVKVLLGQEFQVFPIGKVGDDEIGKKILNEMKEIDLSLKYVGIEKGKNTLFSFCFIYPDKSGGNMTTDNSACSCVNEEYVLKAEKEFQNYSGKGIALAVPEVSLQARIKLLDMGIMHKCFTVASFTSEEMKEIMNSKILEKVNLLCINLDEAASAIKLNIKEYIPSDIVDKAVKAFTSINSNILISITNGKEGSYVWNGSEISYMPAMKVDVVSTAGAGDAFTAGLIVGIVSKFSLREAQELATLTGACSVTSPHTINKNLNRTQLLKIGHGGEYQLSKKVSEVLEA